MKEWPRGMNDLGIGGHRGRTKAAPAGTELRRGEYGDMGIWEYGNMGIWEYGNMGIWEFGSLGVTSAGRSSGWAHNLATQMHISRRPPLRPYAPTLKHRREHCLVRRPYECARNFRAFA